MKQRGASVISFGIGDVAGSAADTVTKGVANNALPTVWAMTLSIGERDTVAAIGLIAATR
jgi:hypothetical protein